MMWRNRCLMLLACAAALTTPLLANATTIPLMNPSFEDGDFSYAWGIQLSDGNLQQIPSWTYMPNGGNGTNWAVAVPNVNPYVLPMSNPDGTHWTTVPMYNGGGALYQDVASSILFEAGKTYTFTASLAGRSDAPANSGDYILARLFYRPVAGDISQSGSAADMWITYGQLLNNTFSDFSVSVTPQPGDPCVGKTMGVVFYDGCWNGYDASYFGVDNVRLSVVPEPSSIVLAISAIAGLAAYAWRKRK
jgi:hypothetical protein